MYEIEREREEERVVCIGKREGIDEKEGNECEKGEEGIVLYILLLFSQEKEEERVV